MVPLQGLDGWILSFAWELDGRPREGACHLERCSCGRERSSVPGFPDSSTATIAPECPHTYRRRGDPDWHEYDLDTPYGKTWGSRASRAAALEGIHEAAARHLDGLVPVHVRRQGEDVVVSKEVRGVIEERRFTAPGGGNLTAWKAGLQALTRPCAVVLFGTGDPLSDFAVGVHRSATLHAEVRALAAPHAIRVQVSPDA